MGARAVSTTTAVLAVVILAACNSPTDAPLWPGSNYTERDRSKALMRAIEYIDRSAHNPENFVDQGSDYLYCFYSIANTTRDSALRTAAERLGREYAKQWANANSKIPAKAGPDDIADLVFGWLSASHLGQSDDRIKPELSKAAARFSAIDYLLFDPRRNHHRPISPPRAGTILFGTGAARQSVRDVAGLLKCNQSITSGSTR